MGFRLTSLAVLLLAAAAQGQGPLPEPAPRPLMPADMDQAMNAGPRGTLAIRAVQGTKGAPDVGVAEVELDLFHRNQLIKHIKAALDEHGVVLIGDIPVAMSVRPLVRIKYSGVMYQEAGPVMDPTRREAALDVTVYQTTDEAPQWHIPMRHVMATRALDGFAVSETVVVENPTDRTWLGVHPDSQGRRATVLLTLPESAGEVRLDEGFHGWCCTGYAAGRLAVQMPLMPGRATYRFSYHLPLSAAKADLRVGADAPIDNAVFFIPDDGSAAEPSLTVAAGVQAEGQTKVRMYRAQAVPAGQRAGLILSGLVTTAELSERGESSRAVKVATIMGAAVVALGGAWFMLRRKTDASRPAA